MSTRTMTRGLSLLATMTLALGLGACGEAGRRTWDIPGVEAPIQARTVEITANEYSFSPNLITVRPGEILLVRLVNTGAMVHGIEFELPAGEVEIDELAAGQTATLNVTAPQEDGSYVFYCPVGNHRELGMTGTLTVSSTTETGTTTTPQPY
ncbi:MAG: cupredoxin domain-containing protein [Myxococcota bacterium]